MKPIRYALLMLILSMPAVAQQATHSVLLIDLTESSSKNFRSAAADEIGEQLEQLTAPGLVLVLGITDGEPITLVEGELSTDTSFTRVDFYRGRAKLVSEWKSKRRELPPPTKSSDIFRAFWRAGLKLQSRIGAKRIISYSDLRHVAGNLNIETPAEINKDAVLDDLFQKKLVPNLTGVRIYAFGVHLQGKDTRYWESLKSFFNAYARAADAKIVTFQPDYH